MHDFEDTVKIAGHKSTLMAMTLCAVVAVSSLVWAMPSDEELKSAKPIITELMSPHVKAYSAGKEKAAEVAAAAYRLARKAEGEAAKYILLKGAAHYYGLAKEYIWVAHVLSQLQEQIKDISNSELALIASRALNNAKAGEARLLREFHRGYALKAKLEKEIAALKSSIAKKPSDTSLVYRLADLYACYGDWPNALKLHAKLGLKAAKFELNMSSDAEYNALNAADDWWNYKAKNAGLGPYHFHAAMLYRKAIKEGIAKGLRKTLAENRIAEVEARRTAPRPAAANVTAKPMRNAANAPYCVIDILRGPKAFKYPVSYLMAKPKGVWNNEYKTHKLLLRRIEPGSFIMGENQKDESKRVRIGKPFYIGVFEVTQKQYELVMGDNPVRAKNNRNILGDKRPVVASWAKVRGSIQTHDWPRVNTVDVDSFIGRLRSRTGIECLDFPTSEQWEYACRAGTSTDRYDGTGVVKGRGYADGENWRGALRLGRCYQPKKEYKHKSTEDVGMYPPNPWGLHDMYGNVQEWCLCLVDKEKPVTDPPDFRMKRGGCWLSGHWSNLTSYGVKWGRFDSDGGATTGFRICLSLE